MDFSRGVDLAEALTAGAAVFVCGNMNGWPD